MNENMKFAAIGAFFFVVLGGLVFLLMQDEPEPAVPKSSTNGIENTSDSGGNLGSLSEGRRSPGTSPDPASDPTGPGEESVAGTTDGTVSPEEPEEEVAKAAKRPRGNGVIKGVVTWHGDGAPVSGASVLLDYTERPQSYSPYPDERVQWTGKSDSNGEFRFTNLPTNATNNSVRGQRISVTATKNGASAVTLVGLTDDEELEIVELELRPSGGIGGQVLNGDGEPVVGAIVTPFEMSDKTQSQYSYGARSLWTATDTQGNFQLNDLNVGAWSLNVKATNFASEISPPFETGETNAKIVLKAGTSLSGTVTYADGGDPVPHIFVTINDERNRQNQQRVKTDEKGEFTASGLADGTYIVQLNDEERILVGEAPRIDVSNATPVEGVALSVLYGGVITGRVTDYDTGEPIEGVRLQARGSQPSNGEWPEGISDVDGQYRISGLSGGSYTVRRRWKIGYLHGEQRENKVVSVTLGEVLENVDFAVRKGLTVSGYVVDKAGDPVAGVDISCQPTVETGEGEEVRTKEEGTFEIRGFSPNVEFHIDVMGRGYTAPRLGPLNTGEEGMKDIKIVVDAGASIAGVVVDKSGKPLSEMYVSANLQGGDSRGAGERTEHDGTFVMKSLEAGTYTLQARPSNSWSSTDEAKQEVTVTIGQTLTGVRLVYAGGLESTISGTVTNVNREPIKDASINVHSPTSGSGAYGQTDAEGKYELSVKEDLTYNMQVYHNQYTRQEREGVVAGEKNVDFVMEGLGTVEGQVLDGKSGQPITQFEVGHTSGLASAYNYQMNRFVSFFNEQGEFSLNSVQSGEATLFARAPGYAPGVQQVPQVVADDVVGGVVFRLQPGAAIEGRVVDRAGTPVVNAQIYLLGRVDEWMIEQVQYGGGVAPAATTDANGQFVADSIGGDLTKITAVHPDFPNETVDVALVLGQVTTVEIVMSGGATVDGILYVNGVPAPNEHVSVNSPTGSYLNAQTDANGAFKIEKVQEGEVTVSASVSRDNIRRSKSQTAITQAGYTTTVDLYIEFGTGAFEGQITQGGRPVSEGYVAATFADETGAGQQVQGTISNNGSYSIAGLLAGHYRIVVRAGLNGQQPTMRIADADLEDGQTVRVDIDLDGGAHVRGIISNATDISRCHVTAISGQTQINDIATAFASAELQARVAGYSQVAADGSYDISGLSEGDYTIIVTQIGASGYADARFAQGFISVSGTTTAELNLTLP